MNNKRQRLKTSDLRILLSMLNTIEQEEESLTKDILSSEEKRNRLFDPAAPQQVWAGLYELPFNQCLATLVNSFGLANCAKQILDSPNRIEALNSWHEKLQTDDSDNQDLNPVLTIEQARFIYSFNTIVVKNLKSLMIYGYYINDLVKIAREGPYNERDKALLKAIKIDPAVILCKTAAERLSRAVLLHEESFLRGLRNSLNGKLGAKEAATYKKMRYVLQALHESNGLNLNDHMLYILFVKELDLYANNMESAKNILEFTRSFKKKKASI